MNEMKLPSGNGHPAANNPASAKRYSTDQQRWLAMQRRAPQADGQFVYAVATTGVFCRPTCPSKLARRENVSFYDSAKAACQAGFRPCKRCRPGGISPTQRQAEVVINACRAMVDADSTPTLTVLAKSAGLSPHHFLRVFKQVVGVTPREYAAARRDGRVRTELRTRATVTEAIYGAGFNSSGRFYENSTEKLGMQAGEFRRGGGGVTIRHAIAPCPLGLVLVAGTTRGICAVSFGATHAELRRTLEHDFPRARIERAGRDFNAWVRAVVKQIRQPAARLDIPLDIRGTAFQQRVWRALREIPPGQTASYAEVAERIGKPKAARAVAGACAANPVAVIVPCHRVVHADGTLSGYHWGRERKRELLRREAIVTRPDR